MQGSLPTSRTSWKLSGFCRSGKIDKRLTDDRARDIDRVATSSGRFPVKAIFHCFHVEMQGSEVAFEQKGDEVSCAQVLTGEGMAR